MQRWVHYHEYRFLRAAALSSALFHRYGIQHLPNEQAACGFHGKRHLNCIKPGVAFHGAGNEGI